MIKKKTPLLPSSPHQKQNKLVTRTKLGYIWRERDGWMVYCIINGLTIIILWVNDDEHN